MTGPSLTVSPPLQALSSPQFHPHNILCSSSPSVAALSALLFLQNGFSNNPIPLGMTLQLFVQPRAFYCLSIAKVSCITDDGQVVLFSFLLAPTYYPYDMRHLLGVSKYT